MTWEPGTTPAEAHRDLSIWAERVNIAADGKHFRCWFMTPGVVNYEDAPGGGQELIRKPAIDESLESLIGCPLTIGHVPTSLSPDELVDYENGKIEKAYFDAEKGWYCCEGTVETDAAREKIRDGWGTSVGTRIRKLDYGPGGTWLNNPYDREINRLKFHHLALIEPSRRTRFEDAEIRLNATNKGKTMFKWIKRLAAKAGEQTAEQVSDLAPDTKLDLGGGKTATIGELVENERQNHCHAVMADDYVEHEGTRYHVGTLVSNYRSRMNADGEKPNTEAGAKKEVDDAKIAMELAERELSEAGKMAEKEGATDEHKRHHAASVERHACAVARHNAALQHLNSFSVARQHAADEEAKKKAEADKAEADKKAKEEQERQNDLAAQEAAKKEADAKAEEERQNAVKAKAAADEKAKKEEEERQNAAARGRESFSILANARNHPQERRPANTPTSIADRVARGKKLFGSN